MLGAIAEYQRRFFKHDVCVSYSPPRPRLSCCPCSFVVRDIGSGPIPQISLPGRRVHIHLFIVNGGGCLLVVGGVFRVPGIIRYLVCNICARYCTGSGCEWKMEHKRRYNYEKGQIPIQRRPLIDLCKNTISPGGHINFRSDTSHSQ